MCQHHTANEIIDLKGILHYQECIQCGKVREYNPDKMKHFVTTHPRAWSEWSAGVSNMYQGID
jgi:hypothetical protein